MGEFAGAAVVRQLGGEGDWLELPMVVDQDPVGFHGSTHPQPPRRESPDDFPRPTQPRQSSPFVARLRPNPGRMARHIYQPLDFTRGSAAASGAVIGGNNLVRRPADRLALSTSQSVRLGEVTAGAWERQ